jgi:hypothetical protein
MPARDSGLTDISILIARVECIIFCENNRFHLLIQKAKEIAELIQVLLSNKNTSTHVSLAVAIVTDLTRLDTSLELAQVF